MLSSYNTQYSRFLPLTCLYINSKLFLVSTHCKPFLWCSTTKTSQVTLCLFPTHCSARRPPDVQLEPRKQTCHILKRHFQSIQCTLMPTCLFLDDTQMSQYLQGTCTHNTNAFFQQLLFPFQKTFLFSFAKKGMFANMQQQQNQPTNSFWGLSFLLLIS